MELWKPVSEFSDTYEVSDCGRVRNIQTGQLKIPTLDAKNRRMSVLLWRFNKARCFKVHRLVLEAFVGPCPKGMEGCHNNGDATDNHLGNLRWDTPTNNHADKIAHGTTNRGERGPNAKLTLEQVRAIRADTRMQKLIALDYGVRSSQISRIKTGTRWQHDH